MSERDLDAEFARIIAGWDDEAPDPQARPVRDDALALGADTGPTAVSDAVSDAFSDDAEATSEAVSEHTSEPASDVAPDAAPDVAPAAWRGPELPPADSPSPPVAPPAGTSVLGLPVAPNVWRGSPPQRDDVDDLLEAVDPDDDHFVPPSEIDLPSAETDPMFWAIVGGLVGGPLVLLYVLFFDREGSGWWVVTGLAMIVVGFVLLVLRGGTERDPFDDGTRV